MKVGVTGGAGFIGSWVVDELLARGHKPVIFDTRGRGEREGVEVVLGDVRDEVAVTELAAHVDGIIHLAAVLGTQETIKNPVPAAMSNMQGGLNFLQAVAQYDLPGVYICVGNHWMNNTYSISKTAVERFVHMFNKERGTRVYPVRVVNAFGPRQSAAPPFGSAKVRKIMPAFICRALSGMPIEVYGDGEQISDCVWVGDVARVLVSSLEAAAAIKSMPAAHIGQVVEVGPSEHHTVNEVAYLVAAEASALVGTDVDIVHLPMRPGEIPGATVSADMSFAEELLGKQDIRPLDLAIHDTVKWFQEMRGTWWTNK